jgi:hypothetical protein
MKFCCRETHTSPLRSSLLYGPFIFWDRRWMMLIPCWGCYTVSLWRCCRHFGSTCCMILQGRDCVGDAPLSFFCKSKMLYIHRDSQTYSLKHWKRRQRVPPKLRRHRSQPHSNNPRTELSSTINHGESLKWVGCASLYGQCLTERCRSLCFDES